MRLGGMHKMILLSSLLVAVLFSLRGSCAGGVCEGGLPLRYIIHADGVTSILWVPLLGNIMVYVFAGTVLAFLLSWIGIRFFKK